MYNCPVCKKAIKHRHNLERHISEQHPDYKPGEAKAKTKPAKVVKKTPGANLKIKPPEVKTNDNPATLKEAGFHCADCDAEVAKFQTPCPACGKGLNWAGL